MKLVFKKRVAFHETDCMGIVHHAVYAKYFEEARVELLYQNNLEAFHAPKIDFVLAVLNMDISYRKPLRLMDEFEVFVGVSLESPTQILFSYEICLNEALVTTGKTLHVGLNNELKVVKPPIELIKGLENHGS